MPAEGRLWPSDDIQNGVQRGVFNHHFWLRYLELPEQLKTKTLVWSATLPDNWIPRWHGGAPLTSVVGCPPNETGSILVWFQSTFETSTWIICSFQKLRNQLNESGRSKENSPLKVFVFVFVYVFFFVLLLVRSCLLITEMSTRSQVYRNVIWRCSLNVFVFVSVFL